MADVQELTLAQCAYLGDVICVGGHSFGWARRRVATECSLCKYCHFSGCRTVYSLHLWSFAKVPL